MEQRWGDALWEGYLLLRVSQVANAAFVTMDPQRGPRSRALGWLATAIAGGATAWEWRRRHGRDSSVDDPVMAAEVIGTSAALMALSPHIVRAADRDRGDDWFGLWTWWGNAALALALPNRPEPAMLAHLLPQVDAWRHQRSWLPSDIASRNVLNSIGVGLGSRWAVHKVTQAGAQADRASTRLMSEQARLLADRARRELRERRLRDTVDSLNNIEGHLREDRIDAALACSSATYEPLRAWLAGAEDDETASPAAAAADHASEMTRLIERTEQGLTFGDIAVVGATLISTLLVTTSRFDRQQRRGWVVAGLTSSTIYTAAVTLGRLGLRGRPGSDSHPAFLDRTWSRRADTLFAVLLIAFECASSDRNVAGTWAAGQTQVHIAVAATRIAEFPNLLRAWGIIGAAMFLGDRYFSPAARTHRFRWQVDWINGMAAGMALRRSHTAVFNSLDQLERHANETIATVAKQVAEAETVAAQDAVHDTACQSLRYLLTHPDEDPSRLAQIIAATTEALETELSGGEHDESGALADALAACAAGYELLGLSPVVESTGDRPVGGEVMEVLVQVANQGLANALAHSDDTAPLIRLDLDDRYVRLTVCNRADVPFRGIPDRAEADAVDPLDDRFDPALPETSPTPAEAGPAELPSGGFGLASARRAVTELGGTLGWGEHPTRTELIVELSLTLDGAPASASGNEPSPRR